MGFGSFDLFEPMFAVMSMLVFGMVIVTFVRGVGEWNKNNHSPRITVPAKVVSRRTSVTHHHLHSANDIHHVHPVTHYHVTFQVKSGDRMEFSISGREYGMLAEGDCGQLTFQGTRYSGFQRMNKNESA